MLKFKNLKFNISIFVALLLMVSNAIAQDIYFAGFSFVGDTDQNNLRYPVATRLVDEKIAGRSQLDVAMASEMNLLNRKDISIKLDQGKLSSGNSIALSFALNEESVETVKWSGRNLYIYRVVAQILVFDFDEKKVIANYPVMVMYQDMSDSPRDRLGHDTIFKKIYLDKSFEGNIFKEWVKKLELATIKPAYKEYIQIRSVKLDDGVYDALPDQLKKPNLYETQVAQTFEYLLASNQSVPMLPYSSGQSIGNQTNGMLARFSDGSKMTLKLPDPGYVIDLLIRPFKSVSEVNNGIKQNAFAAFITLKVEQPDFKKVYVDSKFKNINYINFTDNSDTQLDTWQTYQTSLRALFSNLTKQISIRNKDALAGMTQTKDIDKQLSSFNEVLKKCM